MKNLKIKIIFSFLWLLIAIRCEKNLDDNILEPKSIHIKSAKNVILIDNVLTDLYKNIIKGGIFLEKYIKNLDTIINLDECLEILIEDSFTIKGDTIVWPINLILNYGENNCICDDGNYRKGKIRIEFSNFYKDSFSIIKLSTENYYINNNLINCEIKLKNEGITNNAIKFKELANGGKIKMLNGIEIEWTSEQELLWAKGKETYNLKDDNYEVDGQKFITIDDHRNERLEIKCKVIKELNFNNECKWIISGLVGIEVGEDYFKLDYGNNRCDNIVSTILDRGEYNIIWW